MHLKLASYEKTLLTRFDLLGYKETALAKAFGYLLSEDSSICYAFLRLVGLKVKHTPGSFSKVLIDTELSRREGRTDIEISHPGRFHVIVECKVGNNRLKAQRSQYKTAFEDKAPKKLLCFVTQEPDSNMEVSDDVRIVYLSWLDILALVSSKKFFGLSYVDEFLSYMNRVSR